MKHVHRNPKPRSANRGVVLVVAIILLLLMTVLSLYALNVGVFEQRTSGNDYRTRMVNKAAEMAVSQGMEYFNINGAERMSDSGDWVVCQAADTTFPCGAVPATVRVDGVDIAYRGRMFYFNGGTVDVNGDGAIDAIEQRMMPLDRRVATTSGNVNGFPIEYGAGALLCRIQEQDPRPNPLPVGFVAPPAICTTGTDAMPVSAISIVGLARVPGENASTTLVQTIGFAPFLNNLPQVPPVVAQGTITITGTFQIVTNSDSAGPGLPVSVWTRSDIGRTGTPNTCHLGEFLRFGGGGGAVVRYYPGSKNVSVCDDCSCPNEYSISYPKSGNLQQEGEDILDIDGDVGTNRDVLPTEYPCDLFEYIFGVKAWEDRINGAGRAANFCETRILVDDDENPGQQIGMDAKFLREKARDIIEDADDCSRLNAAARGLIWVKYDCGAIDGQVGSPPMADPNSPFGPVALVVDNEVDLGARALIFGLVFVRTLEDVMEQPSDAGGGGTAVFSANGGAVIYGSVVVQGSVPRINGTAAVIYNKDVMEGLANDPVNNGGVSLPGSWSDAAAY